MSISYSRASHATLPLGDRIGFGRALLVLAGVLLAGLSTASAGRPGGTGHVPPSGPGGPGDGAPGDPGQGGTMMDDESIGSLPILHGGFDFLPPYAPLDLKPNVYVEGPTEVLFELVVAASGSGTIQIQELADGRSQVVFFGGMHVDFALESFLDERIEVGLITGAELGHVAAAVVLEDRLLARTALRPTQKFELPVYELLRLDALGNGMDLYTRDLLGQRFHYRLVSEGGFLRLSSR